MTYTDNIICVQFEIFMIKTLLYVVIFFNLTFLFLIVLFYPTPDLPSFLVTPRFSLQPPPLP